MSTWERIEPGVYERRERWIDRQEREVAAAVEKMPAVDGYVWTWVVWFDKKTQDTGEAGTLKQAKRAASRSFLDEVRYRKPTWARPGWGPSYGD